MVKICFKHILREVFWIYFFAYAAIPFGYFVRILYAKSFTVGEFGLIYSIVGFIGLISIFNDLGFTAALNYFIPQFYEKKEYGKVKGALIFAFLMQVGTAILLSFCFFFLSPYLAISYFKTSVANETFRWFLFYLILLNASKPIVQIFSGFQLYRYSQAATFLKSILILIISLLLIYLFKSNVRYIGLAWGISFGIILLGFYFLLRKKFKDVLKNKADLSFSLYKKLAKYAFFVLLGSGAGTVLSKTDIFMITLLRNLEEVGFYSAALSLACLMESLVGPIKSIIFPLTSKLKAERNVKKIKSMFCTIYNLGFFLVFPVFIVFVSFPKEALNVVYGETYLRGTAVLIILSFAQLIRVFTGFNFRVLVGLGLAKTRTKIMYLAALNNIVLNFILIPIIGIVGAAITTVISFLIMLTISFILLKKRFKFVLSKRTLLGTFLGGFVMFSIILFLKKLLSMNVFIEATIICVISGSFYLLIGYLLKIFRPKKYLSILKESLLTKVK